MSPRAARPRLSCGICAAAPPLRDFGGLASVHRRGERGRRGWGGFGQGWAGFFSCLRSCTCKLKPKAPPELMSVCVCARGLLCA